VTGTNVVPSRPPFEARKLALKFAASSLWIKKDIDTANGLKKLGMIYFRLRICSLTPAHFARPYEIPTLSNLGCLGNAIFSHQSKPHACLLGEVSWRSRQTVPLLDTRGCFSD